MDKNLVTLASSLLICIFHLYRVDAVFNYLNVTCLPEYGNYTEGSIYQQNLDSLLLNLSSHRSTRAYHNSTAGDVPNKVYGLYQCRGDVTQEVCSECIQDATQKIVQGCPLVAEAGAWYDECMLRYANHSIFSTFEKLPGGYTWSKRNVSDYHKLAPVLASTLRSVINGAAPISSRGHFATKANNWTLFNYVYCLAQCTPDLTEFDCRDCLTRARSIMVNDFNTSIRVAIFYASCQLRYDTTRKFYREIIATPPAPSPSNTTVPGNDVLINDKRKIVP
ncbi:Cysteine-rich receptor-like protein kinase 25 [Bienertia sinuspersici]